MLRKSSASPSTVHDGNNVSPSPSPSPSDTNPNLCALPSLDPQPLRVDVSTNETARGDVDDQPPSLYANESSPLYANYLAGARSHLDLASPRKQDEMGEDSDFKSLLRRRTGFKSPNTLQSNSSEQFDFRKSLQSPTKTEQRSPSEPTTAEQIDFRNVLSKSVETKDMSSAKVDTEAEQIDFREQLAKTDKLTINIDEFDNDDNRDRLYKRTGFKSPRTLQTNSAEQIDFRNVLQRNVKTKDMSSAAVASEGEQKDFRSALQNKVVTDDKSSAAVDMQGEQRDYRSEALKRSVTTDDKSSAHIDSHGEQKDYRDSLQRSVVTDDKSSAAHVPEKMRGEQIDFRNVLRTSLGEEVDENVADTTSSTIQTEGDTNDSTIKTEHDTTRSTIPTEGDTTDSTIKTEGETTRSTIQTEGDTTRSTIQTEGDTSSSTVQTEEDTTVDDDDTDSTIHEEDDHANADDSRHVVDDDYALLTHSRHDDSASDAEKEKSMQNVVDPRLSKVVTLASADPDLTAGDTTRDESSVELTITEEAIAEDLKKSNPNMDSSSQSYSIHMDSSAHSYSIHSDDGIRPRADTQDDVITNFTNVTQEDDPEVDLTHDSTMSFEDFGQASGSRVDFAEYAESESSSIITRAMRGGGGGDLEGQGSSLANELGQGQNMTNQLGQGQNLAFELGQQGQSLSFELGQVDDDRARRISTAESYEIKIDSDREDFHDVSDIQFSEMGQSLESERRNDFDDESAAAATENSSDLDKTLTDDEGHSDRGTDEVEESEGEVQTARLKSVLHDPPVVSPSANEIPPRGGVVDDDEIDDENQVGCCFIFALLVVFVNGVSVWNLIMCVSLDS